MVRNDERRATLADAGIRVLAQSGARGLTHRAVDAEAGTPPGTASNYFPTRDVLIAELVARIGERLTPDPELLASRATQQPTRALFATYIHDVVSRLSTAPDVSLALFELRLEAARRPSVAEALGSWRRQAFEGDIAFTAQAGLPGTRNQIALFHYAIDGLMLDRLTVPIDAETHTDDIVEDLVGRLLA